jgi:hypothetical protein
VPTISKCGSEPRSVGSYDKKNLGSCINRNQIPQSISLHLVTTVISHHEITVLSQVFSQTFTEELSAEAHAAYLRTLYIIKIELLRDVTQRSWYTGTETRLHLPP